MAGKLRPAKYPHTVIIISHDRDLLNRDVTNAILHLEHRKLAHSINGNYDHLRPRPGRATGRGSRPRWRRNSRRAKRKHMEAFVERFRAKASKATPGTVAA